MSATLREVLGQRADEVDVPEFDPSQLVAQGQRRVRRRSRLIAGAGVAVVAILVGTSFVLRPDSGSAPAPTDTPQHNDDRGAVQLNPARPLAYADGQTVHFGNRAVDTGMIALTVDITDNGVIFTTLDGGIWFTDGLTVDKVGATLGAKVRGGGTVIDWPAGRPDEWVATNNAGSRAVWWEFPSKDQPEMVVYDTETRQVIGRSFADKGVCRWCEVTSIGATSVYLARNDGLGVPVTTPVTSFDIATGTRLRLPAAAYQSEIRGLPRTLRTGSSFDDGLVFGGVGQSFTVNGSRLVPELSTTDPADRLFASTGHPVRLEAPAKLVTGSELTMFQWLDDDRVALKYLAGKPSLQYVVCELSSGRCHLKFVKAADAVLVAEVSGIAGEHALLDSVGAFSE